MSEFCSFPFLISNKDLGLRLNSQVFWDFKLGKLSESFSMFFEDNLDGGLPRTHKCITISQLWNTNGASNIKLSIILKINNIFMIEVPIY